MTRDKFLDSLVGGNVIKINTTHYEILNQVEDDRKQLFKRLRWASYDPRDPSPSLRQAQWSPFRQVLV